MLKKKNIQNLFYLNMNSFQIKIFNTINNSSSEGENLMISPLSIYHILSLTTNGADGETKKEMLRNFR